MIKKLLLAGALALTFLSEGIAQITTTTTHSFFTEGDATVYHDYDGHSSFPTIAVSNDTVVITATKNGTTGQYDAVEVDAPNTWNAATGTARNIQLKIKANPALTVASGNGQLEISLKDNNTNTPGTYANSTDKLSPVVDVDTSWTIVSVTLPPNAFVDYQSGNCPGGAGTCLIDSTQIAGLLLAPNSGGAYSGTIEVAYIYAGDATLDGSPDPAPAATIITLPTVIDTTITPNASVTLAAYALNAPAAVDSISFYSNGTTLLGTAKASPYTLTWNNVASGTYKVTAVAYYTGLSSVTSAVTTITAAALVPITWTSTAPVLTAVSDSGFYTRGDASPQLLGTSVGAGTSYTASVDANNNLVLGVNITATTAKTYPPVTFNIYNPATSLDDTIALPAHADTVWIYAAATSTVQARVALQDSAGYTADQISLITIKTTPTLIPVALPPSVFGDYYSPVVGGACTVANTGSNPCAVNSNKLVLLSLTPNPGSPYYGDITIGYVYIGDTSTTVQQITGVTAAAATAATSVFPNPTISGFANYNVAVSGAVTATLADMTGKVVAVQNGTSGSFDVSGLNKGVYVVSFALNGAYYSSQKLVVSGN